MPYPKRKVPREVTLQRRHTAWKLRQQGWTHERIAEHIADIEAEKMGPAWPRIHRTTITKLLQVTAREFYKQTAKTIAAVRGEQLAQLSHIADEALQAWRDSRQPTKEAERTKDGDSERTKARTEDQDGNPRFLSEARAALADVRTLLNMGAVIKVAQTDPTGEKAAEGMTDDERADRVVALLDSARARRAGRAAGSEAGVGTVSGSSGDGVPQHG